MAQFNPICRWVLQLEDSTLSGTVVNLMDGQGLTRFGVGQLSHPNLPADFYTKPAADALQDAMQVYRDEYWSRFWGDQIDDDGVASCLLSFSINDGVGREIMLLQQVLGFTKTDGIMGPITLSATNGAGASLAQELRDAQANFYKMLVTKQPTDERFLAGWLKRANLIYPSLS